VFKDFLVRKANDETRDSRDSLVDAPRAIWPLHANEDENGQADGFAGIDENIHDHLLACAAITATSRPDPKIGIGGAPTRNTTLPTDGKERKKYPMFSGLLAYFPDALAAVAHVSWVGNEQHNPGKPLHWDRSKSGDEWDTLTRHLSQAGTRDSDGTRHSAKIAWRALAALQKEIEEEEKF
jgi:hypothetical protein